MKRDAASFHAAGHFAPATLAATSLQQLNGRHARLERELAKAFGMQPWPAALVDRLVSELSSTEAEIDALRGR